MKTKKDFISWWNVIGSLVQALLIFALLYQLVHIGVAIVLSIYLSMMMLDIRTTEEWLSYKIEELEKQLKDDTKS